MSGHNKWSKIKHQKASTDAAKSKVFGKFAHLIAIESKRADGDVNDSALRAAIDRAKAANMPKDNIDRAVAKGMSNDAETLESVVYETYGPGGVAILIDALTDNRNRTSQEIKHVLSKNNCELAASGSAAWAFTKTTDGYEPTTTVQLPKDQEEPLMKLLDAIDDLADVQDIYNNATE